MKITGWGNRLVYKKARAYAWAIENLLLRECLKAQVNLVTEAKLFQGCF